MINILEKDNLKEEIKENLVLVDFYANWCGPCKTIAPILEELTNKIDVKVIKVDVDKFEDLAREYAIMSIPTLLLFKDGIQINKKIGLTDLETLLTWFN